MRRAYNNVEVIIENGIFYGISLGYDFTAEHEWGIADMKRKLGIVSESKIGAEARKVTRGTAIALLTDGKYTLLTTRPHETSLTKSVPHDISHYINSESFGLITAWSGSDFCILTDTPEGNKQLTELYEAAQKNDIIIATLRNLKAFEGTSLSVLIYSRLPQEALDELYYADKRSNDLIEYEEKIGIAELKRVAKKGGYQAIHYFMACSPKWIDYDDAENRERLKAERKTKYDIWYWVNYSDDDNNYGWYSAEEIHQWLSTPGLKLTQIRKANS